MKRRAIVIVTFIAGLYYVLEFLLPPRIGGSPDADGAASATAIVVPQGRYLAYTGLRTDRLPVILGVRADGGGPRRTLIAPNFARKDDYRGARTPEFVPPDRLYYIGLGYDDRTPRVCMARLVRGRWRPNARAVLSSGGPGETDASGIRWASVLRPDESGLPWRMWYVGLQGDRGAVCLAESRDGITWHKQGKVAWERSGAANVQCVSALRNREGVELWLLFADTDGATRAATALLKADGRTGREAPTPVAVGLPPGMHLADLRVIHGENGIEAFAGLADSQGLVRVARMVPTSRQFPEARLTTVDPALIAPGKKPRSTYLSDARGTVDDILVVIGAFAVGLGLIGLAQVHGKRILALQTGWPESTAFFVAAIAMAAFTTYARLNPDARTWGTRGYELLFYGLLQPLGSSMFSLLAAYLVSAAYRAFRVRSFEGGLLAASATLIMLGQVPVGNWLTQHLPTYLQIPRIMAWVLFVSNTAVVRAVNFGIFVGALATALRVWLSMDRASMRSVE